MREVMVQFLGSGDAFGSGGRLQPCVHLRFNGKGFLIDCGTSSLIAMKRMGVATTSIDAIFLTHLHGDHFGGLPFLFLNEHLIAKRKNPLLIVGPPGTEERIKAAMEVLFPGSSKISWSFSTEYLELSEKTPLKVDDLILTPFTVTHASGAPSFAFRIECGGKIISFSGDTEWTDALVEVASGADLFVSEAYFWSKKTKYHLDYHSLMDNRDRLGCKKLMVTHMSDDLLARLGEIEVEYAEDGKIVSID